MKTAIPLFTLFLFGYYSLNAQINPNIENATTLVWYGLDYSNTQFISTKEFSDPKLNINDFFHQWNEVFVNEKGKYNLKDAFKAKNIVVNLDIVTQRNNQINMMDRVSDEKCSLNEQKLNEIINEIHFSETKGLGLICIVETLDKNNNKATAFFTFIDLESKEIVYIKWLQGAPGGAGFRNFWVNPFADMLEQWIEAFR